MFHERFDVEWMTYTTKNNVKITINTRPFICTDI